MEIKIGRKVSGILDILVPENFINVSKEHAAISVINGNLIIQDLESQNGTFVNGRRVLTKELTLEDLVVLGGEGGKHCYSLNLTKIAKDFKKQEHQNRTDFVKEFQKVKATYKSYQSDLIKLKRKSQFKSNLPKIILSALVGIVIIGGVVFKLLPDGIQKFQGAIMLVLMAIVGGVSIFKVKEDRVIESQMDLEIKYQENYKCPKCQGSFNLKLHWKKLESKITCPHKCGAIFKK